MQCGGPWSETRAMAYLDEAVLPIRLACVSPTGWPLVVSLWFLRRDRELWCATPARARIARALEKEARCAFEVSVNDPPYCGVRGRGRVRLDAERGHEALEALADRYLGAEPSAFRRWLLSREEAEVALRIRMESLTSWDFRQRMSAGPS